MQLVADFPVKVRIYAGDNYKGECWRAYMELEVEPCYPILNAIYLGTVKTEYGLLISEDGLPELLERLQQEYPLLHFT